MLCEMAKLRNLYCSYFCHQLVYIYHNFPLLKAVKPGENSGLRRSPRPPSRLGRGKPSPHSPLPRCLRHLATRRLWRLVSDTFGVGVFVPPLSEVWLCRWTCPAIFSAHAPDLVQSKVISQIYELIIR